ncbi:hypothetical protein WJX73_004474 [Symbiochloris irregularis]|uniref:Uncharacterized protein n=1 Tax=Symbiochloris irregularis TaxID=706552 RepID=A0AAW1Q2M1_9CHLO
MQIPDSVIFSRRGKPGSRGDGKDLQRPKLGRKAVNFSAAPAGEQQLPIMGRKFVDAAGAVHASHGTGSSDRSTVWSQQSQRLRGASATGGQRTPASLGGTGLFAVSQSSTGTGFLLNLLLPGSTSCSNGRQSSAPNLNANTLVLTWHQTLAGQTTDAHTRLPQGVTEDAKPFFSNFSCTGSSVANE